MKDKLYLVKQGFFKEMSYSEETDNSIKPFINTETDKVLIDKVCKYLDSGVVIMECCGTTIDALNESNGIAGVPSLLTDGVWVWPGDLSYYVKKYKIKLTDDFMSTLKQNNFNVNVNSEEILAKSIYVDGVKLL
jgi:hypothetical protein